MEKERLALIEMIVAIRMAAWKLEQIIKEIGNG